MRGGVVLVAAGAVFAGLVASSGGDGSGRSVVAAAGQAGQANAGVGDAAAGGACVPGDGGLPAPGEPRHDSLTRPAEPIPAGMQALYQQAGQAYGLPWELLAGVGMIETGHGANKNTSSAGAQGPMQFMPGTWAGFGVDGDSDGVKDVLNPADAVPAAANYLKASGAPGDYRKALFAYNRANWYVNDVLWYAQKYGARVCAGVNAVNAAAGPVAGVGDAPPSGSPAERGLRPAALHGLRAGAAKWPEIKTWGGKGGRPNKSDHPNGRAVDGMIPGWNTPEGNAYGWQVARWFQGNAAALQVTYIIWDDQIWRAGGSWKAYTHPNGPTKSATLRHLDHVHVSFLG